MSRILIIEDSDSMREQLVMLLSDLNHNLSTASNGLEAVQVVRQSAPFDLMITDMFMPEMDGIEAIEQIKSLQPDIKIIAISGGGLGMSGAAMLEIADGLGAQKTLPKPFQPEELRLAVEQALAA
ncbi:MAG: response regulator [Candidatus Methylacidiphilales bacterium]|nr:response regulator [Candidatus Methylacidiphilales bacterium]